MSTGHLDGPPPLPSPGEKQKLFRGPTVLCWRSRAGQPRTEGGPAPLLEQGPSAGRQEGQGWDDVSPGERVGEFSPLSALTRTAAASFAAQQGPALTGARGLHQLGRASWGPACRPGRAGEGAQPRRCTDTRGRGTQATFFQKPPQPARREKPSQSPRAKAAAASAPASVWPLVFLYKWRFFVSEKVSLPLKRRRPGQHGLCGAQQES